MQDKITFSMKFPITRDYLLCETQDSVLPKKIQDCFSKSDITFCTRYKIDIGYLEITFVQDKRLLNGPTISATPKFACTCDI